VADIRHDSVASVAHVNQYRRGDAAPSPPAHTKSPTSVAPTTPANTVLAVCGNGVIEHGEECDCGSPEECAKDPCCNAKICKLALGAQCSNQQDCCDRCQFRPATFVCRAATADCDSAEICTGKSGKCPANKTDCPKHHSSTTSNSTDTKTDVSCGSVPCSTRDLQCQAQSSVEINLAEACTEDISSCQVSCTDPRAAALTGSARCLSFSAYFTDGTECGQGGVCTNGSCSGDKGTQSFFKKNVLAFAIGGGCIVVALLFCFLSIYCLRRRKRPCNDKEERHG
ncbi:Disintegrin-domain-containing protein, partial [Dissophora ornata]